MNFYVGKGAQNVEFAQDVDAAAYLSLVRMVERAHRRFLDVVKDELDRTGRTDINNVQAMLLHSIGSEELTASELRARGYYLGSNVSYNVKKLVELGFIEQNKSTHDRRTVKIRLTAAGRDVVAAIDGLIARQLSSLQPIGGVTDQDLASCDRILQRLDRYWVDQIRYRL